MLAKLLVLHGRLLGSRAAGERHWRPEGTSTPGRPAGRAYDTQPSRMPPPQVCVLIVFANKYLMGAHGFQFGEAPAQVLGARHSKRSCACTQRRPAAPDAGSNS